MPLLLILAVSCFVGALAVRLTDPVVPDIAREFATAPETVALLASAFAFPYALGQPVLGPLGDALGKARIIKVCLAGLTVMLALAALAPTLEILFLARIAGGVLAGGTIPLAIAMVGDRFTLVERQVALSQLLMAMLVGQFVSVVGAGFIGSLLGWRTVMLLAAGLSLLALVLTLRGLEPRANAPRPPFRLASVLAGYGVVFENPRTKVCYAAVFIEGVAIFGFLPYIATLLEARGAGGVREAGFVLAGMGVGGIIYGLTVRRILDELGGQMNMIRAGGAICAGGLVAAGLVSAWPHQAAALLVAGIGFYMIHNSLQTQATELAPKARGAAVALHAFFFFLGQAAGPIVYQLGFAQIGPAGTLLVAATVMGVLAFIVAALLADERPSASSL